MYVAYSTLVKYKFYYCKSLLPITMIFLFSFSKNIFAIVDKTCTFYIDSFHSVKMFEQEVDFTSVRRILNMIALLLYICHTIQNPKTTDLSVIISLKNNLFYIQSCVVVLRCLPTVMSRFLKLLISITYRKLNTSKDNVFRFSPCYT